jgi:hypothetical protein
LAVDTSGEAAEREETGRGLISELVIRCVWLRHSSRPAAAFLAECAIAAGPTAAGIAPAAAFSENYTQQNTCVNCPPPGVHAVCSDLALRELVVGWQVLFPGVRQKIMEMALGASYRWRPNIGRSCVF